MRAYINHARKYAPLSQFRDRGIKKTPPLSHFYIIMLKIDNPSRWTIFLIMRDAGEMLFSMSPRLTPPPDYSQCQAVDHQTGNRTHCETLVSIWQDLMR